MAAPVLPPGTDHGSEQIPRQVVYRRFASETHTVEVTSTAPWTAEDQRPDHEKELATSTNTKEQPDKALKWTSTQPSPREGQRDTQNPAENRMTSQKVESTAARDKPADKSMSHPILNEDKRNIYKADSAFGEDGPHFGGRRLSLYARDKVVGGAAMMFPDPLDCSKTFNGERRKSEFDAGRLSSVTFATPESRKLTEEHNRQSTLRVRQQTNDKECTGFNTEAKRTSLPGSDNNASKCVVNSLQSTSNKKDSDRSTIKPESKITLEKNTAITSSKTIKDSQFEKVHSQKKAEENCSSESCQSRSENIKDTKVEENKIQTSSNAGHVTTDKATFKSDPKVNSECSRLYSEKTNVSEPKCDKSHSQSNGKINSSFPHNVNARFHEPDTEEKEVRVLPSASSLHPVSENLTLKNQPVLTVQGSSLFSRSQDMPHKEAKIETNKLQTSSDANGYKSASRSAETNNTPQHSSNPKSSFSRSDNTSRFFPRSESTKSSRSCSENTNSSIQRSENTKSSFARVDDARASGSKMEGSKNQTAGTSNTLAFHQSTDKCTSRTQPKVTNSVSPSENTLGNDPKNVKEETTSTQTAPLHHQRKNQITIQKHPLSGLQGKDLNSEDRAKYKENLDGKTEHGTSAMMTATDKSVCHLPIVSYATIENRPKSAFHVKSLDTTDLNQNKPQSCPVTATDSSALTSLKEASKYFASPRSSSTTKNTDHGRTVSRDTIEKPTPKRNVDPKAHVESVTITVPKTAATPAKTTTVSATAQSNPSTPKEKTAVRSSHLQNAPQDQRLDSKVNTGQAGRSRSVCCSSKHEPRVSSREPLASRPLTRSKSDVGGGNKGRAATPARKSCAERRCCGAQSGPLQEAAATLARAHSLSRGPPMGSTASLTPKNKSSWTTQRALESEVQQLKRELQMHKAEELRLHREIHKLRSVLQQATSFGEETAAWTGDPDDGALLASLQDRHGMAGAAGVPVGASKKQGVSGESCEPESIEVPRHEKDMRSRQLIKAAILDNDFLKNLARSQIRELVDCMYPQRVQAGSYVIREGEAGSHLYVLDDGEMEVLKEGTVLGRMGPGKAFGELAILYNCTRTASIRAVSDLQVWVLDRRAFQQIMMRTGMQRLEDNIAFLRSVPLLRGINEQTLARIADALEPEFYPTDEYIVRQGARGNTFFIISGGSVEVTQRGASGYEVVLRTLGRGEYFGEQALLHDDCRTASVRALAPGVDCLTLDGESFNALIGSLSELHHKDYAEDTKSISSRTSFNNDCRKEDEAVSSLHLDDLRPLGTLGVGGFGCVRLVMAPNGRSYALKCLSKRHVAATGQQEHVSAERDVLLAARSPFIVRLLRTFRDEANVYLLLEACLGGEVWALLREHERLPDKAARFIAACVLEALEYLHARDIVYRDLKPENLVMDAVGYVKLVDFGFCKRLPGGCKTWTFCGTPEYVAPEVILNRGHDRAVDYWALGVLIYELLTGAPPFAAADPMGTYNLILLGMESAIMPKYMSRTATDLIRRLCRAAPSERLGYQRGSFREVKAHRSYAAYFSAKSSTVVWGESEHVRWFQDFDWDALRAQSMTPPIKPQVSGPTDMSNFYPQTLDEELAPAELSHWDADF